MKLRQSQTTKLSLSQTLRSWLPILQADIESLEETLEPFINDNPLITLRSGFEKRFSKTSDSYTSDIIELLNTQEDSLYDVLTKQITPPLFPTRKSKQIAYDIIKDIDTEGYFKGDIKEIASKNNCEVEVVERIRQRFAYLEPSGVGAIDLKESFIFQLNDFDVDDKVVELIKTILNDFENIQNYSNNERFTQAISIIKKFKNPPAIKYLKNSSQIVPDIFIYEKKGSFIVDVNNSYYPEIILDAEGVDKDNEFIKEKIKSAKDLVDALEMRKATLYKIGLMILEYQYDFFKGGDIKPMKLKDLAYELDRNPSTISRAISNKYLSCNRGTFALKDFFSTALDDETSNTTIKVFIKELIKNEDRKKPISDNKILQEIEKKFGIKIVRRTITKYRKQMSIPGSSERKKLYLLNKN